MLQGLSVVEQRYLAVREVQDGAKVAASGLGPAHHLGQAPPGAGAASSRSSIYRCLVRHRLISSKPRRRRLTELQATSDHGRWSCGRST
jgi:hypothetical protein